MPDTKQEQLFDLKSYKKRKQELMDMLYIPETTSFPNRVKDIMALLDTIAQQAYIAGANRIQLRHESKYKIIDSTGEVSVLAMNFSKDKGLCQ